MAPNDEPRQIPGFYYDKEKKKYFAVQRNAPASAAYSSGDVKRRKIADEDAFREAKRQRQIRKATRVSRALMSREFGDGPLNSDDITSNYINGLVLSDIRDCQPRSEYSSFVVQPRVHPEDCTLNVLDIHFSSRGELTSIRGQPFDTSSPYRITTTSGSVHRQNHMLPADPTTSLKVHPSWSMIAATGGRCMNVGITLLDLQSYDEPTLCFHIENPGNRVGFHTATAAPDESSLLFAFGTDHGIYGHYKTNIQSKIAISTRCHDIFALEFLSDNHNILLSGGRGPYLDIIDLRANSLNPQFEHKPGINHIRHISSHRILVAGLGDSNLCQYDLRLMRTKSTTESPYTSPIPLLHYPEYQNKARMHTGFDIDVEAGVVAAYQDWNQRVSLFSLAEGKLLKSREYKKPAECIQFVDEGDGRPKTLWVGGDFDLERWVYASEDLEGQFGKGKESEMERF